MNISAPTPVAPVMQPSADAIAEAKEVKEAFTSFVGQTVFSNMLKSMRDTVGKPAYFHGGQAEEVFRSQLDQTLAEEMTKSDGSRFAEGMFAQQFPNEAAVLKAAKSLEVPTLRRL